MRTVRWFGVAIGVLLIAAPTWVFLAAFGAVWHGNPIFPISLLSSLVVGLVALGWSWFRRREPGTGRHPRLRLTAAIAGTLVVAVIAGTFIWLIPFSAKAPALASLSTTATVRVVDHPTSIEMVPAAGSPTLGLVFSPGARVDARAYAEILRPQAEAGFLVVILKVPFGLGIIAPGQSGGPIAAHPEIKRWVVGGHSLGGTSAGIFAADSPGRVAGLLFYASYPLGDLSGRKDLAVESISGSNDELATPADIEASRAKLPADATFTVIQGGVHAYFGDYGDQPGDGTPTVSRPRATDEISTATTAFLRAVAAGRS